MRAHGRPRAFERVGIGYWRLANFRVPQFVPLEYALLQSSKTAARFSGSTKIANVQ